MMVCMLLDGWSFWVTLVQAFVDNIAFFHYLPIVINFLWRRDYEGDHSFGMRKMKAIRTFYNLWSERVYWFVWIGTRIVWYPIISVWSLVSFSLCYDVFGWTGHPLLEMDRIYLVMVLTWVVFANADHFWVFYQLWKEEDEELLDALQVMKVWKPPMPSPSKLKRRVSFQQLEEEIN
mgnify:FL=1